jgi:thioredoxin 1
MTELLFFYMQGCPYCRQAERIIQDLLKEQPALSKVNIRRIDENAEQSLSEQYDYWYVPTFFLGKKKLYEADPSYDEKTVRAKLNEVLNEALKA